jgi:PhoPQ-activated pathogenicity-related protein
MKMRKIIAVLVLLTVTVPVTLGTALDDYVAAPDASYSYSVVRTVEVPGCTGYVLEMTSQSWRSEKEVDRTLWKHWLTIIKPDNVTSDIALLWITGGSNDRPAPERPESMLIAIAQNSGTVVAELRMVPNQPLNFPDGGRPRYEDAIIAYTFDKYVKTGDATWPLLLPMVKSAVRAMDTIQNHIASATDGKLKINKFVVSGGSKRGWTTWLTAAVDKRVIAIAPAVIDVLNMDEQMRHHYAAYGFYSRAIEDYQDMNIFARLDTPEGQALIKFIDPYEYRDRYTMPKFLINSSGDQFFLCDSAQFYFHDLPGEKYLRYVPNTDHGLGGSDAEKSLLVFYVSILKGLPRPKFSWRIEKDSIIVSTTSAVPREVNLWQATNEEARDFRLQTIGKIWQSSPLQHAGSGSYVAKVLPPKKGWTAFFVELVYDSGTPIPYKFTTEVHVVPQRLPFAK